MSDKQIEIPTELADAELEAMNGGVRRTLGITLDVEANDTIQNLLLPSPQQLTGQKA